MHIITSKGYNDQDIREVSKFNANLRRLRRWQNLVNKKNKKKLTIKKNKNNNLKKVKKTVGCG